MTALKLAMDKSARTVDKFGRLYIAMSNISKATVNPYRGSEIPGADRLGLDPDRIYNLLRDPEELRKAADSFNNIPLLDRHIPVTAQAPSQEFVVGSTGTDARFDDPFLRNSLVVWTANAIAGINTNQQRELSCAYSYDPDMTPGTYEGIPYDGIMRNIKGNHVALVEVGRAGPDVVVGDSKLSEKPRMAKKLSANGRLVAAALMGALGPVLAQDAQIGDLSTIVGGGKSFKSAKEQERIVKAVQAEFDGKLAQDASLDHLPAVLKKLAQDEDPENAPKASDEDDEDDEEAKKKKAAAVAAGEDEDAEKVDKPAMDAAIAEAVARTQRETVARMQAIQQAEREVEPHIGRLAVAQDSAEAVYRLALDSAKVEHKGIDDVKALRAMVGMLPKAGDTVRKSVTIAQDAKGGAGDFASMFPNANKMKGGA